MILAKPRDLEQQQKKKGEKKEKGKEKIDGVMYVQYTVIVCTVSTANKPTRTNQRSQTMSGSGDDGLMV